MSMKKLRSSESSFVNKLASVSMEIKQYGVKNNQQQRGVMLQSVLFQNNLLTLSVIVFIHS